MRIYKYGTDAIPSLGRAIALGFFDGVHLGHRAILHEAGRLAREHSLALSVFTFTQEADLKGGARLQSTEAKLRSLSECGVEEIILADFDKVKDMTAEDFVRDLLVGYAGARFAVSGSDYRFGKGAKATAEDLRALMRAHGGDAIAVDDVLVGGEKVSTTRIKTLLAEGRMAEANEMLGAPFTLSATVEHGRGVGHTLGFPTVNCPPSRTPLRLGVYKSCLIHRGKEYPALTNVGVCPTFDAREVHAETYVIDSTLDLYGESVDIILTDFLRDEIAFSSEKELKMQINIDIKRAKGEI